MSNINYYLVFFVLINFILTCKFDKIKIFHLLVDKPDNKRKFHLKPTPLAGGLLLLINILLFFIMTLIDPKIISNELIFDNLKNFYFFLICSVSIFVLGYFDDKFDLGVRLKFFILIFMFLIILFFDTNLPIKTLSLSFIDNPINLTSYTIIFTCFCFLVFTNAFNMFDGINLQSSFYSLIIFSAFLIFYTNSLFIKVLLIFFIFYSYLNYKNKTFLGDSGSLLTAFIIGYLFVRLYNLEKIEFADDIFIFMMIPGIDMIRLFFKRILLNKNPFKADRLHLHHLLICKFSNEKTILLLCSLILFPIFLMFFDINRIMIILVTILAYSFIVQKN